MNIKKILPLLSLIVVAYTAPTYAAAGAVWSYEGDTGPSNWGNLSADYELCGTGLRQSPVDLSIANTEKLPELNYQYEDIPLSIENNGHTIEVHYGIDGKILIDGSEYNLLQFHFHSPSEHTVDNTTAPMELHFVHINSDSQLAVIGVLIDEGDKNLFFESIISNAPIVKSTVHVENTEINAYDFLPERPSSYKTYSGSLTTPPCSESVRWLMLNERIEVSRDQIDRFLAIIGENARPVQFLNDRIISERK